MDACLSQDAIKVNAWCKRAGRVNLQLNGQVLDGDAEELNDITGDASLRFSTG